VVKDFFKVDKVRAISFTSQVASNAWKLARDSETNDWKLADLKAGEQLDTTKVSGVANALISPSFVDVATGTTPEQAGLDKPTLSRWRRSTASPTRSRWAASRARRIIISASP